MSDYEIEFESAALRDLKKLSKPVQEKLLALAQSLSNNPRPHNVESLTDFNGLYRVRSGNYRLVYQIIDSKLIIIVVAAGDRQDIYKLLKQRFG